MKINVYFRGRRTTARVPGYLWDMACLAEDVDSVELSDMVHQYLAGADYDPAWTASEAVRHYLCLLIELALVTDSSRPGSAGTVVPGL